MTRKEKIIATAYTGIMFIDGSELGELYKYEEEKMGQAVIDVMYSDETFVKRLKDAVRNDFIEMLRGKYEEGKNEI